MLCDAVAMSRWVLCATRFCSRAQEMKVLSSGLCLGQAFTVAAKDVPRLSRSSGCSCVDITLGTVL